MWFAPLSANSGGIDFSLKKLGGSRHDRVRKSLQTWLPSVGVNYHKPHNFRHGHAVFSLKTAKTISDLKAISLNLMHSDIKVTDSVYAVLSNLDVKDIINNLGGK